MKTGRGRTPIYSNDLVRKIVVMYESGLTPQKIAQKSGIHPRVISRLLYQRANVKAKTHYTVKDMAKVKDLYISGEPLWKITKEIGCCRKTVFNWLDSMGIENKTRCEIKTIAVEMYKSGTGVSQISGKLNCARSTVYNWIREDGVPLRKGRKIVPEEIKKACVKMRLEGHTLAEVAGKYNVATASVREWTIKSEVG